MATIPPSRRALQYVFALTCTALAAVATRALTRLGDSGLSPLFFAAVFASAWYGGLGPGLLATTFSGVATGYLLMRHGVSAPGVHDAVLRVMVFSVVTLLTSAVNVATKRAAEAFRRAKEAAEEAGESKNQFIAMVSHELRSPLNPIVMVADSLCNDLSLPPHLREDVELIRRSVALEVRLIDDLVDLTRIGAGKLSLQMECVDLDGPLSAAVATCKGDAHEKRLVLTVERGASNTRVNGDPVRLQQIFWNLLRNAIKFTPDGGSVRVKTQSPDTKTVAIEVFDSGIGIEPERLSAIFRAFEQGAPDITARFGGLGLGLTICQALTEAHGGTLTASSPGRGRGATFVLRLPTADVSSVAGMSSIPTDSAISATKSPI